MTIHLRFKRLAQGDVAVIIRLIHNLDDLSDLINRQVRHGAIEQRYQIRIKITLDETKRNDIILRSNGIAIVGIDIALGKECP